jgi:TonB family protein
MSSKRFFPLRAFWAAGVACISMATAAPAAAQAEAVALNGWTIRDHRGHCSALSRQGGGLVAEIVHHGGSKDTALILGSPSWSAIRERNGDAARLRFSNGRSYDAVANAGRRIDGSNGRIVSIFVSTDSAALLDDFARARGIDISIGGAQAGTLSLTGSYAVAERLRRCAAESFRRYPPPSVRALPGAPPPPPPRLPTGESPPIQRIGSISNEDYPAAAIRAGEQGTVSMRLVVGENGMVTGCTVIGSSGSADLDSASCSLAARRFRFTPARDSRGNNVASTVTRRIRWMLPAPEPEPQPVPEPPPTNQ